MKKKKFGEILMDKGLIDQKKLDDALKRQIASKRKLGETLVLLGYINEEQLTKIVGDLAGIPAIDLTKFKLEKEATKYLPGDICAKYKVVPIAIKNHNKRDHLLIAFADPLNLDIIDELRFMINLPIFRVSATSTAIKDAIKKLYPLTSPSSTIPGEIPVSREEQQPMEVFSQGDYHTVQTSAAPHSPAQATVDSEKIYLEILTLKKALEVMIRALGGKRVLAKEEIIELQKLLS